MKIGCCSNMLYRESAAPVGAARQSAAGTGTDAGAARLARTGIGYVDAIARAGFDYIELPLAQVMDLADAEFDTLLKQLAASGLPCLAFNNCFPVHFRLTGPAIDEAVVDDYFTRAMTRVERAGASRVVFGSGPAKMVPAGFPMDEAFDQIAALLRRLAPAARAHGVTIAIEPLRHQECNIINTYAEGCRLARAVDDANVKVLVDYYHLGTEREPASDIIENAHLLCHAHTARLEARGFPTVLDDELNRDFYSALKAIGYDGGISLEAYTDDFEREAPASLAFLRVQTRT